MANWLTGIVIGAVAGACFAASQGGSEREGLIAACVGGFLGSRMVK